MHARRGDEPTKMRQELPWSQPTVLMSRVLERVPEDFDEHQRLALTRRGVATARYQALEGISGERKLSG
jgi:hypothetical protein